MGFPCISYRSSTVINVGLYSYLSNCSPALKFSGARIGKSMKLHCLLLAMVGSCFAVATASLSQSDMTRSVAYTDSKLLLRRLKDSLNGDNSNDEERVGPNVDKVDEIVGNIDDAVTKLFDDIPSLAPIFKNWRNKLTVEEIFSSPTVAILKDQPNDVFMRVFNLYGEYVALGEETFLKIYKAMQARRIKDAAQR